MVKWAVDLKRKEKDRYSSWIAGTINLLLQEKDRELGNIQVIARGMGESDRYTFDVISKDILKRRRATAEDAVYLKKGDVFEDENIRIRAFGSTDVGISFLIEAEGKLLFHAGDLNNWHWKDESTPQEVAKAEGDYLRELDILAQATGHLHLAMFPVDPRIGTDFMRGAEQFVDRIKTDVLVPMHFWERPAEVVAFGPYAESKGCRYILLSYPGESTDF